MPRLPIISRRGASRRDPNGFNQGMTGPLGYWHVSDIKKTLQALLDAGGQVRQEPQDVGGVI
jgi:predicted enzyme related to lactoylglutathione lyase